MGADSYKYIRLRDTGCVGGVTGRTGLDPAVGLLGHLASVIESYIIVAFPFLEDRSLRLFRENQLVRTLCGNMDTI